LERIRRATPVCYPQRDVFIERSGLDWIPVIVAGWPHCTFSSFKAIAPVQYLPRCASIQDWRWTAVEKAGLPGLNEGQVVEYEEVSNRGKTSAENLKVQR
jgi:hypothetical protein